MLIKEGRHNKDFELQTDMIDGDAEKTNYIEKQIMTTTKKYKN